MSASPIKHVCIGLAILLVPGPGRAQLPKQRTIDSLLILASKAKEDTNKVLLLARISQTFYAVDLRKGGDFGNQALKLSQKLNWKKGMVRSYHALGSNYWAKYDFIKAQDYYGQALKIAEEIGDKRFIAITLHDIGICYDIQGNFNKAITYYKKSIDFFDAAGDPDGVTGCNSNIADIYLGRSNYMNAITYYGRSLEISKRTKKERDIGYYSQQIGAAYSLAGDYKKAFKYVLYAGRIFRDLKDYEDLALNANRLGNLYLRTQNYGQAITQSRRALAILEKIKGSPIKKMEADFYISLGNAYFEWSNKRGNRKLIGLAAESFQKAANIALAINYRESAVVSLRSLSEVESRQGRFADALSTYKKYIINRDSLSNSQKDKEYARHELSFEYAKRQDSLNYAAKLEKKEMERIKALSADKVKQRSLYAIVVSVILLFSLSYFFFRNRLQQVRFKSELAKEKSEIKLKQMSFEKKLNDLTLASLKSQMNPHFIFNCLNSIKFYVEKNDTDAASLYISKFSKLIRNILDSARSEKVTLGAEIELIGLYLEMEQMRLKEKLQYKFDIAKNLEIDFIEIPPLLIQPYVENAIWHGLMPKEKGGTIIIKVSADENRLFISITDDGIGREKAAALKSKNKFKHTSYGSALNSDRITMFNTKYKTNTEVTLSDLKDEDNYACGTMVTIKLLIQ